MQRFGVLALGLALMACEGMEVVEGVDGLGANEQEENFIYEFIGLRAVSAAEMAGIYERICLEGVSPEDEGFVTDLTSFGFDDEWYAAGGEVWSHPAKAITYFSGEQMQIGCSFSFVTRDDSTEIDRVFEGADAPRYDIFTRDLADADIISNGSLYYIGLSEISLG